MLETIAEHTVDISILPEKARILDIGCRGFIFANHMIRSGHSVYTVDADPLVSCTHDYHYNLAITDFNGYVKLIYSNDKQATRVKPSYDGLPDDCVPAMTLESFSKMVKVDLWDVIKIDVEGSELEIIRSLKKAPATQLSIEFHLHTGVYGITDVKMMEDKLTLLGYVPIVHDMTKQHGLGLNYWDSLWVLK